MQKVLDILEQHVQWIAIGLGALFVLFMTYSYVLTPPAQVTIAPPGQVNVVPRPLSPGEIDTYTVDSVVKPLENAINMPGRFDVTVPKYVQSFQDAMAWKDAPAVALGGIWNAQTSPIATPTVPGAPEEALAGQPVVGSKVTQLPQPPKPVWADKRFGRSLVIPPVLGADGQLVPAPQAGQPGAEGVDRDWVTQLFKIPMADLAKAWQAANLPRDLPQFHQTAFLQVELAREERDSSGNWGNQQVIPPLQTWQQNPPPPFPAEGDDPSLQAQYLEWAIPNQADILQPRFYETLPDRGDQWTKPGEQTAEQVFDPTTFQGDLNTLSQDQRKQVLQLRKEQTQLRREQERSNRPAGSPRQPAGGNRPPEFAPELPNYAPAPPRVPPRPSGRTVDPGTEFDGVSMEEAGIRGYGGYGARGGYGAAAGQPGLPQPGVDYPNGEFDPAAFATTPPPENKPRMVEAWAHDDTVEAGKTYRYRMRYKLKNPIWGAGNLAEPETLSDVFALVSEYSEWSDPVNVPSLVNFFVASSKAPDGNTVRFEIFRWDNGQQKMDTFSVSPGDQVGGEKNGVDYSTEWTVVDFRDDPRINANDTQILLVNNNDGNVIVRSYQADSKDSLYRTLKSQANQLRQADPNAIGSAGAAPMAGRGSVP